MPANVKGRVREAIRGAPTATRWLVFDAEGLTHVDSAGVALFRDLGRDLEVEGIGLALARMKSPTRQRFDEAGVTDALGPERFYPTVRAAVAACTDGGRPELV